MIFIHQIQEGHSVTDSQGMVIPTTRWLPPLFQSSSSDLFPLSTSIVKNKFLFLHQSVKSGSIKAMKEKYGFPTLCRNAVKNAKRLLSHECECLRQGQPSPVLLLAKKDPHKMATAAAQMNVGTWQHQWVQSYWLRLVW